MFRVGFATLAAAAIAMLFGTAPAPAQSRPPLLNAAEMATVDQIRPGMKGVGKSVFQGTRIESFGITVLGVLRRVDFGSDLILVRIDSGPPVSKGYGVVSGMSGSPVYVDGKLIGALAYAWSFSKQPIAGVTPIAQMLEDYLPGSAPVASQGTLTATTPFVVDGVRIERATVAPTGSAAAQAQVPNTAALTPIATPLLVSGMNPRTIGLLRTALEPLGMVPLGAGGAMDRVEMAIAPGAAVGARLIGGDFDATAVGTVTYARDGVVLAFGHPMALLGKADVPLVAAHVHGVMPSAELSFKLASAGQTLGRFTQDRPWCLGGVLGELPTLVETRMSVLDRDRRVRRSYRVEVIQDRSLTSVLLIAVLAGAVESVAAGMDGTTRVRFSFEAEGLPRMTRENTYSADGGYGLLSLLFGGMGGTFSATQELSSILDLLQTNPFGEARLLRLWVEAEVSDRRCTARLERVRVRRPQVSPGEEVAVEVVLRSAEEGEITRVEKVRIPASCPPGRVRLGVAGGRSAEGLRSRLGISQPRPQSLEQMLSQTLNRASNDELVMQLALPTVGIEGRGFALRDLPPAVIDVLRSAKGTQLQTLRDYEEWRSPTDWVVSGQETITLVVEGEEKDKGGRPPSPQYRGSPFDDEGMMFGALFDDVGFNAAVLSEEEGGGEDDEAAGMDLDGAALMPSWEEVESAAGGDFALGSSGAGEAAHRRDRGDAIGRIASIWQFSTYKEMAKGKCTGAQVASTGAIVLGPEPHVLTAAPSRCVWAVAAVSPERVYFGTWGDGCLRSWTPESGAQVVLETSDAGITALAAGSDGTVYAAAAPSGSIYRLSPGEEPEEVCRLDAPYIWALVWHDGGLLAGTGPDGVLYRVGSDGQVSSVFQAADRHITALAAGENGTAYLGTAPRGKVYALSPDGGVRSVCEIEKSSIQSLAVGADGTVYVGTSPDGRVLRIGPQSEVHQLLKVKAKHVLALRVSPDGTVYAGIGPPAGVYAISADESWTQVYDPKSAYVTGLAWAEPGAVYVAVGDTGDIVELDTTAACLGRYDSPVLDAKSISRWGTLQWHGVCPEGAGITLLTRAGGTAFPDDTWSRWQAAAAGQRTTVASPSDRFLQWRAELTGSGAAPPRIELLEISYLPANQSPEITLLAPKQSEIWSGKKTIRWRGKDADGDKLSYEAYWSTDRGETWTKIEGEKADAGAEPEAEEAPEAGPGEEAGEASPAEESNALGSAEAREPLGAEGESLSRAPASMFPPETMLEGEDLVALIGEAPPDEVGEEIDSTDTGPPSPPSRATTLEWDTTAVADGVYRLQVVASDGGANPADPKEDRVRSPLVVVDNTPPELVLDRRRADEDPPPDSVTAFDAATYISSAEFRIDEGEWLAAMPEDGIFDSQLENILLDLARLPEGVHPVEVRVRDAAGNVASSTLRYRR